ncbi:hypothetical protein GW17_00036047 [Ensete ventricosum]|nr:hypothetical protein GW17_00036047 [Ensete ventricosum]
MTLPMAQADVGSVEHRGSRIKRRPHTEAAASSGDRTRRQPHAAEAAQAAARMPAAAQATAVSDRVGSSLATALRWRPHRLQPRAGGSGSKGKRS